MFEIRQKILLLLLNLNLAFFTEGVLNNCRTLFLELVPKFIEE